MKRVKWLCLAACVLGLNAPAQAGKGDLTVSVPRVSDILASRTLDLRFADFAQGIWTQTEGDCQKLTRIDVGTPGDAIAIYRGLFETPGRVCLVYGAEQDATEIQRAAMNCRLDRGGSALGLVTVAKRGSGNLLFQEGERPPVTYQFCKAIPSILEPFSQ